MSVAFRREIDEEHLEPTFELPLPPGPNWVTERGLRLTRERVDSLEAGLVDRLSDDEMKARKRELRYWRTRLATAEVRPAPAGDIVAFGTRVTYRDASRTKTVTIVGDDEADPRTGLISFTSPLARTLMDAEVGEAIPFGPKDALLEVMTIEVVDQA